MPKLINFKDLKDETMKPLKDEYIKPDRVYIKIDNPENLKVKINDYIYKGQIIGEYTKPFKLPIISTISGTFKEIYVGSDKVSYVSIENDFLEKYEKRLGFKKNICNYTKKEFIDLLYNCAVTGQGGAGFPTYIKYNSEYPVNLLIINAIECEPNVTTDYVTMLMHTENILDAIDAIININGIERAVITINSRYTDIIERFNELLGSYPEISLKICNVKYSLGQNKMLVEHVTGEKYTGHAHQVGVIVNNVSTIYDIYRVLKYRRPVTEKIITLAGELMPKPKNVLVKIGMMANTLGIVNKDNALIITGGPLVGDERSDFDFIISPNEISIMLLKPYKINTKKCINCGKCQLYCPMDIPVIVAKRALTNRDLKTLRKCDLDKCIKCGLCSYICPANINLKNLVVTALGVISNE